MTLEITTVAPLLLDHALPGPPQGRWTVDWWERLPDDGNRYEIIEGTLGMTTAPSAFHQWIVSMCIELLGIPARARGLGIWFTAPIGVILSPHDAVQPDFLFIRAERVAVLVRERRIHGAPDLIIEVLSPGNSAEAMAQKRAVYARAGVAEYVEIDPAQRTATLYRLEEGVYGTPVVYDATHTLRLSCLPDLPLPVAALFAGAPDTTL
ncbi:MAG: Uma2 family endonuclease [Roseiflexaceae bacterium]|nr:Uma2 family endonuclease [Roseiflexus sp.]MDW8234229.1 Uma2 family endonuclease [Roseiflexaceae bacterium]